MPVEFRQNTRDLIAWAAPATAQAARAASPVDVCRRRPSSKTPRPTELARTDFLAMAGSSSGSPGYTGRPVRQWFPRRRQMPFDRIGRLHPCKCYARIVRTSPPPRGRSWPTRLILPPTRPVTPRTLVTGYWRLTHFHLCPRRRWACLRTPVPTLTGHPPTTCGAKWLDWRPDIQACHRRAVALGMVHMRMATVLAYPPHTPMPRSTEPFPSVQVGSSRVDLQACKLEYSIVSPK